ncbi:MAG: IS66 family transposase, partial [Gemmatimonadales bacterium]
AGCGRSLTQAPLHRVGVSQVVELPPVQPRIIEARRYAATCAYCGVTTTAPYPPGLEPTRVFGPQLEAVVAYLHEEHHVGYARVQAVTHDLFGLALSPGAIANILARTAARLAPAVAAIREQVRASPVIGSDETSARVRGQTWWQGVFQAPTASYHVIVPRRNGAVVETFLGDVPVLVWVSDLWKPQLGARAIYHQVCLAHQLRDLQYVIDAEHSAWAAAFQALLTVAIHLAHDRDAGRCTGAGYAAAVAMLEAWCTALLATPVPGAEAARLWVRYRAHRDHLFVFLAHPEVPPTNNASERALRNSVIHRKITGGFRSEWGAEAHAAVMTVLQTARKQGRAVLATLQDALGTPFPALPAPSPSSSR